MKRPAGVIVISVLFLLAAIFLWMIGAAMLVSPGTIPMSTGAPLMYGLELGGPYMALLVGSSWALVSWGLWRLHRWARWAAMILISVGIGLLVPVVSQAATDLNRRLAWAGAQIIVRAAAAWYLAQSAAVHESFAKK
jgi:hypothetical protein